MEVIAKVTFKVNVPIEVGERYQNLLDEDWSSENFANLCDNFYYDLLNTINENKSTILNNKNLYFSIDSIHDKNGIFLTFED